jgi:hypothetical protein
LLNKINCANCYLLLGFLGNRSFYALLTLIVITPMSDILISVVVLLWKDDDKVF